MDDLPDTASVAPAESAAHGPAAPGGAPSDRRFLHVFPSFNQGGVPIRIANVLNHLGPAIKHTVVALDGGFAARARLDPRLDVTLLPADSFGRDLLRGTWHARAALRRLQPGLLLTYNWGAVEWALANAVSPVCPHVHFESGFGSEESDEQMRRRVWLRRIALRKAFRLVVPSRTLLDLATRVWKIDPARVACIPNGVDCVRFAQPPRDGLVPGFSKRPDELIVGTAAPLRAEKNLPRLLRAFAALPPDLNVRLLIAGDGAQRDKLVAEAAALNISNRLILAGHVDAVEHLLGWFDVFAMSSDTEQMPNSLLQAMAAGLPVAATDVGDVKHIVSAENRPFVVPKRDEVLLAQSLGRLLADADLRARVGAGNRTRVRAEFSQERMFAAYVSLFEEACAGRP